MEMFIRFWEQTTTTTCLSETCGLDINSSPELRVLIVNTGQIFNCTQKQLWLSACTVAAKMLAVRWQPPHSLSIHQWNHSVIEILTVRRLVARMNGAGQGMMEARKEALNTRAAQLIAFAIKLQYG